MGVECEVEYLGTAAPVEVPFDATLAELADAAIAAVGCDYDASECTLAAGGVDLLALDGATQLQEAGVGPGEQLELAVQSHHAARRQLRRLGIAGAVGDVEEALRGRNFATVRVILAAQNISTLALAQQAGEWYHVCLEELGGDDVLDAFRALLDGGVPHTAGRYSLLAHVVGEQRLEPLLMLLHERRIDPNLPGASLIACPDVIPLAVALVRQYGPNSGTDSAAITAALLDAGADVHARFPAEGGLGVVAAVAAAPQDAPDALQAALALGGSPDAPPLADQDLGTPLYLASKHRSPAAVQVLLDAGCTQVNVSASGATYPLSGARKHEAVLSVLLEAGADLALCPGVLRIAVDRGEDSTVALLLSAPSAPAALAVRTAGGAAVIHHAKAVSTLALLISAGADVNVMNTYAQTPLGNAVRNRLVGIVEALVAAGAKADEVLAPGQGRTSFQSIDMGTAPVDADTRRIVELLVAAGADPREGLVEAVVMGRREFVDLILDVCPGAAAAAPSLLGLAVEMRHLGILQALFLAGADLAAEVGDVGSVVHKAAHLNEASIVDYLAQHRSVDINARRRPDGRTPLHVAAAAGAKDAAESLLAAGADRAVVDADGYTAAQLVRSRHPAMAQLLPLPDGAPSAPDPTPRVRFTEQ